MDQDFLHFKTVKKDLISQQKYLLCSHNSSHLTLEGVSVNHSRQCD